MGERDTQRQKVYEAERAAFRDDEERPFDVRQFADVAEAQAYVDRIERSAWFRRTFPRVGRHVTVRTKPRGNRWATGGFGDIDLPGGKNGRWAFTEAVVLHELAHNLVPDVLETECPGPGKCGWLAWTDGRDIPAACGRTHTARPAGHGPEFARIFHDLVWRWMDHDAAAALLREFRAHRVRMASPASVYRS